jgi:hypothetical protein
MQKLENAFIEDSVSQLSSTRQTYRKFEKSRFVKFRILENEMFAFGLWYFCALGKCVIKYKNAPPRVKLRYLLARNYAV